MADVEVIELSERWLLHHAADCCLTEAWALIQGYPATGFGCVRPGEIAWKLMPDAECLEWSLFSDVRLFGDVGEWHCWRDGKGIWRGRYANPSDPAWRDSIKRDYLLWGQAEPDGEWYSCREVRGAQIWVPSTALTAARTPRKSIRLKTLCRVDYQAETGLAGITDVLFRGFGWEE